MNLEELRSVQDAERRQSGLQSLRESFYEEAGKYVADLKAERARQAERAEDPFSNPEVGRLTDEIETAEEVVEAIYERRMGKLLKRASLAAADMSADEEGLTAEEKTLFYDLVDRIEENKSTVLETIAGERETGAAGDAPAPGTDADGATSADPDPRAAARDADGAAADEATGRREVDPGSPPPDAGERPGADAGERPGADEPDSLSAAGAMGRAGGESDDPAGETPGEDPPAGESAETAPEPPDADEFLDGGPGDSAGGPDAEPADAPGREAGSGSPGREAGVASIDDIQERVTVRITDDVGEIYGVDDREYDLERETVVELPEQNAEPLVERGAAERLE